MSNMFMLQTYLEFRGVAGTASGDSAWSVLAANRCL